MSGLDHTPLIRFGIITDIHFSLESEPAAAVETAADLRRWLVMCREKRVDGVLQLGDLIKGSENDCREELHEALKILREFSGTVHHVIGNHCLALPRQKLLQALGMQAPFYAFAIRGFRIVVLDGMDLSTLHRGETPCDRQQLERYLARTELHHYCGAIGEAQQAWLKRELDDAEQSGEQVIVICHFPLLEETTEPRYGLLWNHRAITALLAASPAVKACISGHYHYGGYGLHQGIHFVVLPAFVNRSEHPAFACGTLELQNERMVIRNQNNEPLYDLSLNQ